MRLVEGPIVAEYQPARTFGWAALEILVPDLDQLAEDLKDSPFEILIPPATLSGLVKPALRAMQAVGPSLELIYFTEILDDLPPFDLPRTSGAVDGVFIAVVAARELETTRTWFESNFALERASDRQVAVQIVNYAFGLDKTTLHRISSLKLNGQAAIEHDQYPEGATERPGLEGHLPPGVAAVSLYAAGYRSGPMLGPDGLRVELVPRD